MGALVSLLRIAVRVVLGVLLAAGLVVAAAAFALRQPSVRERIAPRVASLLADLLHSEVRIGSIGELGRSGVAVADVTVVHRGETAMRLPAATVGFTVHGWLPPRVGIGIAARGFELDFRRDADGSWNVERMFAAEDEAPPPAWLRGLPLRLAGGTIRVHGLGQRPLEFAQVGGEAIVDLHGRDGVVLAIDDLRFRWGSGSDLRGSGWIGFAGPVPIELELSGESMPGADVRSIVPAWPVERDVRGWATVAGSFSAPRADVHLSAGRTVVEAWAALAAPDRLPASGRVGDAERRLDASAHFGELDPSQVSTDLPVGILNGTANLAAVLAPDGSLLAPRADARAWDSSLAGVAAQWVTAVASRDRGDWQLSAQAGGPRGSWRGDAGASVAPASPHATAIDFRLASDDPGAVVPAWRERLREASVRAAGTMRLDRLERGAVLDADVRLDGSRWSGVAIDEARGRVRLDGDVVSLGDAALRTAAGTARGHGWISVGGRTRGMLAANVEGSADLGVLEGFGGQVTFAATAWGRDDDLSARIDVRRDATVVTPAGRGSLRGHADLARIGSERAELRGTLAGRMSPAAALAGLLGEGPQEIAASGSWSGADASRGAGEISLDLRAGRREQRLVAQVERAAASTRIELRDLRVAPPRSEPWRLEHPATLAIDERALAASSLALRSGPSRLALDGRLARPPGTEPGRLVFDAADVDLGDACGLAGIAGCGGRADAHLVLAGTPSRPDLSGRIEVDDLAWRGKGGGRLELSLRTAGDLVIDGKAEVPAAGRLEVSGELPIEPGWPLPGLARDRSLSLRARAPGIDLAGLRDLAPPGTFTELRGSAGLDVAIAGTPSSPTFGGDVSIEGLSVGIAATGTRLRRGSLARLARRSIEIAEIRAEDGRLVGSGRIDLADLAAPSLDVSLDLDRLPVVALNEVSASASGSVRILGTVPAPEIRGDLVLSPVTIRPSLVPGRGGVAEADPTIHVVNTPPRPPGEPQSVSVSVGEVLGRRQSAVEAAGPESAIWRRMRLGVRVALGEQCAIRRNDADIRLRGEVWATKREGDDMRITGQVFSERGWYVFQGRRLELDHAWVSFSGETPIDPYLDVAAVYRDAQYRINVGVQGTARQPALDLSSEPSLDQSDILAMLLFGKRSSQLTGEQGAGLQQEALGLLASYVAPGLERSVIDTFGLTNLTFAVPSGSSSGAVSVGRYFGDDLFVSFSQELGATQSANTRLVQGVAGSSVTVQFHVSPNVTVQGAASSQGESAVDVIWHMRYGGVAPAAGGARAASPAGPAGAGEPSPAAPVGVAPPPLPTPAAPATGSDAR